MQRNDHSRTIAAIGMSISLFAAAAAHADQGCLPIGHNRGIERVSIGTASNGETTLYVELAAAVSGTAVPSLNAELIVNLNGRTISRTAVDFGVPSSGGTCGFVTDDLQCGGVCGTSGKFTCKGMVFNGGMYCGCSILKAEEVGPYSPRPNDRLTVAVVPAPGAASELFGQDDRQELVIVRSYVGADSLADGKHGFVVYVTFDNTFDAGGVDVETVRLNGTLAATSAEVLKTGFRLSFSQSAMLALGLDASNMAIAGRLRDGARFWGAVQSR